MHTSRVTDKQLQFYRTFRRMYIEKGYRTPLYRDLIDELNYRSPNSVTQNISALVKKGYLVKVENEGYAPVVDTDREGQWGNAVCPRCGHNFSSNEDHHESTRTVGRERQGGIPGRGHPVPLQQGLGA